MWKNAVKLCCVLLIWLIIFLFLLYPFWSIGFEDILRKWDIDNPYVNSNFSGWNDFSVSDQIAFKIPPNWSVKCNDKVYTVINDCGEIWAWAAMYDTATSPYKTYKDFVATFAQVQFESVVITPYSDFIAMKGGDINKLDIHGAHADESFYYIVLTRANGPRFVLFLQENIADSIDDYNIAEAIVYSFAYVMR